MPPLAEWYVGRDASGSFFRGATHPDSAGPVRYVPTRANNSTAFGIYSRGGAPFILQVLLADRDGISAIKSFMNPARFPAFDL